MLVAQVNARAAARAHSGRGGVTRHLAIVGPTASGKSAVALAVARAFDDVEIVSLDSMQVYRGMDIGTAKPSRAEQAAVRHHLVDVADPSEEWSVRATQTAAQAAVADIEARPAGPARRRDRAVRPRGGRRAPGAGSRRRGAGGARSADGDR